LHDDAGRQVRDAHCRVGLVDVLTARAAGAIGVDLQIFRVDFDHDVVVDIRRHRDRGERRLAPPLLIERRDPHETVHSVFGFE
jgi:hypothetical protein